MDAIFITINDWMTGTVAYAVLGSFLWGMVSVLFSPCHLASIPLMVAYVAGQDEAVNPQRAVGYSAAFSIGLFINIVAVGVACTMLGRMLGDVGNYWQLLVGAILVCVALGMLGIELCSFSGSFLARFTMRGIFGAFVLGLSYGFLSGTCTFGFIAPILAIVTIHGELATGIIMTLLFASGHCLPIIVAGSSTALVRKLVESHTWQGAGSLFRKSAGIVIGFLGVYFALSALVQ